MGPEISDKLASYYGVPADVISIARGEVPADVVEIILSNPEAITELRRRYGPASSASGE
ncbi:Uncharacterised protein [Mycolicibacterium aichiense]|nr:Uncharacterised protein [Mycolicibacterium aichiense]